MSKIALSNEIIAILHQINIPVQRAAEELIVLELYRRGVLSSGKAAKLLNMFRDDFIRYASNLGIPFFDMSEDEWNNEIKSTRCPC